MVTGTIKNKVDKIWDDMAAGGITNPLTVIEQLTYLMFIRSLDEKELENEESPINKELTLLALGFDPDALTQDEYSQLIKTRNKSMFKYRFSKKHRRKK